MDSKNNNAGKMRSKSVPQTKDPAKDIRTQIEQNWWAQFIKFAFTFTFKKAVFVFCLIAFFILVWPWIIYGYKIWPTLLAPDSPEVFPYSEDFTDPEKVDWFDKDTGTAKYWYVEDDNRLRVFKGEYNKSAGDKELNAVNEEHEREMIRKWIYEGQRIKKEKEDISLLQKKNKELQYQLATSKGKIVFLTAEKAKLKSDIHQLTERVSTLSDDSEKEKEIKLLQSKNNELHELNTSLKIQRDDLNDMVTRLEHIIAGYKKWQKTSSVATLTEKNRKLQAKVHHLERALKTYEELDKKYLSQQKGVHTDSQGRTYEIVTDKEKPKSWWEFQILGPLKIKGGDHPDNR